MRVLIVDDHKINRLYLKSLLEEHFPIVKKIDEANSVASGKDMLEAIDYDVLLLDIELSDGVGFDMLKNVKDFLYIVIVSCYKDYAIQAFKHNVVDYVLKPVNINEFRAAIKRVIVLYENAHRDRNVSAKLEASQPKTEVEEGLMVNYKNEYIAINRKDILFIKALGKYSEIHVVGSKCYMSYKNLKEFENALSDILIRIHHSYLVNIKSIVSYSKETSRLLLTDGKEIPVSVRKREELFKKFQVF